MVSDFRLNTQRGRKLFRESVDLFIAVLRQIKGDPGFQYRMTDADVAGFDGWVAAIGADKIGSDFMRRWAEYQFQSWFNDGTTRDYNHAVRYNWIFNGGSAVKRWLALPEDKRQWVVRTSLKRDFAVRRGRRSSAGCTELFTTLRVAEEAIKKRFAGTSRGLLWCIANTTLYNHRSAVCVVCKFKSGCLETLKREFPRVAVGRGYLKKEDINNGKKE
jgi:hypothetical protein